MASPYVLYVEGEDDERILRAWARQCNAVSAIEKVCFNLMGGGSKKEMNDFAKKHFDAVCQIVPDAKRLVLFDYDTENSYHPESDNPVLCEWKRKNIENYMFVPSAWRRAAVLQLKTTEQDLLCQELLNGIDKYFADQNLTLPTGSTWKNNAAKIFEVLDGKQMLFEDDDSLFQLLRNLKPDLIVNREKVALNMLEEEIHEDVNQFMAKLISITNAH